MSILVTKMSIFVAKIVILTVGMLILVCKMPILHTKMGILHTFIDVLTVRMGILHTFIGVLTAKMVAGHAKSLGFVAWIVILVRFIGLLWDEIEATGAQSLLPIAPGRALIWFVPHRRLPWGQ